MCSKNKGRYYKLMSCITLVIMLAALAGLIVTVVRQFKASEGAWEIIKTFLNMLATLVMGSAFANLFYSQGIMYDEKDLYEGTCDITYEDKD